MENVNEQNENNRTEAFSTKELLEDYIKIFFGLGAFSEEIKKDLMQKVANISAPTDALALTNQITELYNMFIKKSESEQGTGLQEIQALFDIIEESIEGNQQVVLEILQKVQHMLETVEVKMPLFKEEIIANIKIVSCSIEEDEKLESENIAVIVAMLNHLHIAES